MLERLRQRLKQRYPRLYAARHVAKPIGSLLLVLLGVAVFFTLPLPSIDLPDIPFPDVPSPDLPDLNLPGWVGEVLKWGKYVVLIAIGLMLALNEYEKHKAVEGAEGPATERGDLGGDPPAQDPVADQGARRSQRDHHERGEPPAP